MFRIPEIHFGAGRKEIQLNPFKWFGGGGGTATITLGSLQSRQAINLIEVISEGEIEGFPSAAGLTKGTDAYSQAALKDIFLDKTPIIRPSADPNNIQTSDFNFQRIKFEPRFGTATQTHIKAISEIENETSVGVQVTNALPVTRTVNDSNIDAIRVTIRFDGLVAINEKDGKNLGTTVDVFIEITENDGTVSLFNKDQGGKTSIQPGGLFGIIPTQVSEFEVRGRSRSSYSRDFVIPIREGASFPIQVKVGRSTADSTSERVTDTFSWASLTTIIDERRAYPDIAHLYLRLDAEQFSNVPQRMYRIRGIKIKIPHNATVDQTNGRLIYSGTFNGTLTTTTHWCSDPAWILFDLLTSSRYGLGEHITEAQLDKFAFYSASLYSSELVDDGDGGQEPRFSCNVVLQKREDAFKTVMNLSSVMRGMTFWSAGSLILTQDRPTDASYLFNLSNVTAEGFVYSGTSLKTRSTVVSISYFDMENQELNFETVEDTASKNKYGIIHKKITGFACSSRNQARRLGRFVLFEEQNSSETINFATGLAEGVIVRPGQVIEVSDPVKAGVRRGGRIKSATTTTVTVDNNTETDLDETNSPTLSVIMPDGTVSTKNVASISGAVITLASGESFQMKNSSGTLVDTAPNSNSVWILQNTTLQTTQWRVVSVTEDKDNYAVTATAYNAGKYAFIEDGTPLPVRNITVLNETVEAPGLPNVVEEFFVDGNVARTRLNIDFNSVPRAVEYELNYRLDDGNFITLKSKTTEFQILDSLQGEYEFQLFSINSSLEPSAQPTTFTFTAFGKTALPEDVTNLTIEPINEQFVRLRFKQATAIDVLHGGRVYVRHTNQIGGGATFQSAQDVIEAVAGNTTEVIVPALEGTYLLKFQDDGGRFSANATSVALSSVDILDSIIVKTDREDTDSTPYNGAKSNVTFDSSLGGLKLTNPTANASGTYDFVDTLDLGSTFSLTLKRHFQGAGFYVGDQFDNRTENIDTWTDFDGTIANDVNAKIAVRTTTDNPSGSPTYTSFNDFANGTFKGRGFQFRITLSTADTAQNMNLQQAGYTATMPSRTEQSSVIASGAGAKAVTFTAPFFVGTSALGNLNSFLPSVNISPQNMATGDFFELSNISGTGFTVHFKNSSNASIDRNFTYSAVGFGKGG